MPLSALALVVLAGFIHACWNIAAKKAGGDVRFVAFTSVVLMVFWAPVGLWVGWAQVPAWGLLEWGLVLASALLHIVYFIVLLRGYRQADLTVVYPLARGSGPAVQQRIRNLERLHAAMLLTLVIFYLLITIAIGLLTGTAITARRVKPKLWNGCQSSGRVHGTPARASGPAEAHLTL